MQRLVIARLWLQHSLWPYRMINKRLDCADYTSVQKTNTHQAYHRYFQSEGDADIPQDNDREERAEKVGKDRVSCYL